MKRAPFFCRRAPSLLEAYYILSVSVLLGVALVAVFMEQGPKP